jgi:starch-binding outer membrane protein, SusD/RagB family
MNRIFQIIGVLVLFSSCDVLNVKPEDSISANEAFKNKSGIESGIMGSYSSLQSLSYYGRAFIIFGDLSADNLIHPPDATNSDYAEIGTNAILPENGAVEGLWASMYDGINVANNVIDKVPGMPDMTEAEKSLALGELYFLRALNHFNLVNLFGGVPIKTSPTVGVGNLNAGRDPVADVYAQIIADLTFAENNLPDSPSTKIRATKFAAKALLARVALYEKNYDLAWSKANEVITDSGYSMEVSYKTIFGADGSKETIFEIDFSDVDRNRIAEHNFPKTLNGRREVAPSSGIISAFEEGDARDSVSIAYDGANAYANKYNDLSKGADNVIVLRLAEMYLIRAEAQANITPLDTTAVQDDITTIRERAGLDPCTADTKEDLLLAIESERRVEFAFEGHRWYDLVRTGRAVDLLPNVTNVNKTLFPIPASELQTNTNPKMIQNPGYL